MSCTLTLLRQVVLLRLALHIFAPSLQTFGLTVQKLHEPAAIAAKRRHASGFGYFMSGFHQPGFGLWAGRPAGGPVVLTVAEEALCAYGPNRVVLCGCTGFRMPLKSSKLQTLVFGRWKPLQLQISLNCRRHTVGPFKAAKSESAHKNDNIDSSLCRLLTPGKVQSIFIYLFIISLYLFSELLAQGSLKGIINLE